MNSDAKSLLVIAGIGLLASLPEGVRHFLFWPVAIVALLWLVGSISDAYSEAEVRKERETNARHQAILDAIDAAQPPNFNRALYGPPE